jgi:hypothetical protein
MKQPPSSSHFMNLEEDISSVVIKITVNTLSTADARVLTKEQMPMLNIHFTQSAVQVVHILNMFSINRLFSQVNSDN